MSHDTRFPTSYDREPLHYVTLREEEEANYRKLSLDMLRSASEYAAAFEEMPQRQVFQEAKEIPAQASSAKYFVSELRSNEGRVTFGEDLLEIELSKENGLFFFRNSRFNIFGCGFTKEEAHRDFSEFFIHDYLSYKDSLPEELTQDARQLLDEYESLIATFDPA
jgi:hypothetical protein